MKPKSEKAIVLEIMKALKAAGFYCWKQHGGPYQQAGLPDIFAVRGGKLWAIEVKRPGQPVTKLQAKTLEALSAAGAVAVAVTSVEEVIAVMRGEP